MIEYGNDRVNPTRIKVLGIGGGGSNVINRMVEEGIENLEFISINTDLQNLIQSKAHNKVQIGIELTQGLGAGAKPEVGRKAAEENLKDIEEAVGNANMVFITSGMGGGTGTGASPLIARMLREKGVLVVAVVTKPFEFEGAKRMDYALKGLEELKKEVDTIIIVPNENLLKVYGDNATVEDCFHQADKVLMQGVRAISELITKPGIINVDFSDVKTVMKDRGEALMGMTSTRMGEEALSPERLAKEVLENPILEVRSIHGAKGVLINIRYGKNIPLSFVNEFSKYISIQASGDADIIVGMVYQEDNPDEVVVTLIATGFESYGSGANLSGERISLEETSMEREISKMREEAYSFEGKIEKEDILVSSDQSLSRNKDNNRPMETPYDGQGEYIDVQNIELPAFLRKKRK